MDDTFYVYGLPREMMHPFRRLEFVETKSREPSRGIQSVVRVKAGEEHLVGGERAVDRVQIAGEIQGFGNKHGECTGKGHLAETVRKS